MRYQVQATVVRAKPDGWRESKQIPTFFLDGDIQGITGCEHAAQIAQGVIDPLALCTSVHIAVWNESEGYFALDT